MSTKIFQQFLGNIAVLFKDYLYEKENSLTNLIDSVIEEVSAEHQEEFIDKFENFVKSSFDEDLSIIIIEETSEYEEFFSIIPDSKKDIIARKISILFSYYNLIHQALLIFAKIPDDAEYAANLPLSDNENNINENSDLYNDNNDNGCL
jgi:hypothetical protein